MEIRRKCKCVQVSNINTFHESLPRQIPHTHPAPPPFFFSYKSKHINYTLSCHVHPSHFAFSEELKITLRDFTAHQECTQSALRRTLLAQINLYLYLMNTIQIRRTVIIFLMHLRYKNNMTIHDRAVNVWLIMKYVICDFRNSQSNTCHINENIQNETQPSDSSHEIS